jgi:hypothetical protein
MSAPTLPSSPALVSQPEPFGPYAVVDRGLVLGWREPHNQELVPAASIGAGEW